MRRTETPTNGFVLADAGIGRPSRSSHSARKRGLFEQILDSYFSNNVYFPIVKSYRIIYIYIYIYLLFVPQCRVIQNRQLTARLMCTEPYSSQLWVPLSAAIRVTWPFNYSLEGNAPLHWSVNSICTRNSQTQAQWDFSIEDGAPKPNLYSRITFYNLRSSINTVHLI